MHPTQVFYRYSFFGLLADYAERQKARLGIVEGLRYQPVHFEWFDGEMRPPTETPSPGALAESVRIMKLNRLSAQCLYKTAHLDELHRKKASLNNNDAFHLGAFP